MLRVEVRRYPGPTARSAGLHDEWGAQSRGTCTSQGTGREHDEDKSKLMTSKMPNTTAAMSQKTAADTVPPCSAQTYVCSRLVETGILARRQLPGGGLDICPGLFARCTCQARSVQLLGRV